MRCAVSSFGIEKVTKVQDPSQESGSAAKSATHTPPPDSSAAACRVSR